MSKGRKNTYFLLILFLTAGFFIFPKICKAASHLIINEVQITGGTGKTTNDFIEIYNPTGNKINLKEYRLVKRTKTGTTDTNIKSWVSDTYIKSHDYYLWANSSNNFALGIEADISTTESISDDNGIAIRKGDKDTGEIIDSIGWGGCQNIFVETLVFSSNPGANKSIERKNFEDSDNNSADFEILDTPTPTHSQPDSTADSDSEPDQMNSKDYSGKVKINEIYPAPNTKEEESEFVEIKNLSNEDIDFSKWCLKDKIEYDKAGKGNCKKIAEIKKSGDFYVFYGTFSLNNDSKGDSVFLYDSNNNLIDNQSYQSTKAEYSYAYDTESSVWRWTSKKTPGAKNEFDKILSGKIKKDDSVYAGMYASFEVKADSDAQKFTWDFGDGHKSYLKKTKHKYEKAGEYAASLKISGNGEASQYFFTVKVEKYTAPKVKIVGVKANPKGKDMDLETITIKNNSKKKVNLQKWSVATGWKELYNHPINKKFILKPGETRKLTRKYSTFTLNNKQTKIELRQPDGVVASKVKYSKKEGVKDDETYEKTENGWGWNNTEANADETKANVDETQTNTKEMPANTPEIKTNAENIQTDIEGNAENKVIQADDIEENPQVLGAEIIKNSENVETLNIKSNNSNYEKQKFFSSLVWELNQKASSLISLIISFF